MLSLINLVVILQQDDVYCVDFNIPGRNQICRIVLVAL